MFQSSPGSKAGRYDPRPLTFQSSPGSKAGRSAARVRARPRTVSILARLEGRALQRHTMCAHAVSILARLEGRALLAHPSRLANVSILARLEGRALRRRSSAIVFTTCSVSILARLEGRALRGAEWRMTSRRVSILARLAADARCFNPRPARRPGAPIDAAAEVPSALVFQSSPGAPAWSDVSVPW